MRLYSNCKIGKGYLRDIIIDLERGEYYFAPKYLSNIITDEGDRDFEMDINDKLFLLEKNLIFESCYPFTKSNTRDNAIHCSSIISNCTLIIESTNLNDVVLTKIIAQLDTLGCKALQLIGSPSITENVFLHVLSLLNNSKMRCIELIANSSISSELVKKFFLTNPRITFILFYNAEMEEDFFLDDIKIWVVKYDIPFCDLFTQKIKIHNFVCNIMFYNESLWVNPFYYKKLCINSSGDIYDNFISNNLIGNLISENSILEVVNNKTYCEYSTISKELIDVCKHCEFKNVCPDNRIPQKRDDGSWYHVSECNYNPYIAKWNINEGYKTLAECDIFSDNEGFKFPMT